MKDTVTYTPDAHPAGCAQCGKDNPLDGEIDGHKLCAQCFTMVSILMAKARDILAKQGKPS